MDWGISLAIYSVLSASIVGVGTLPSKVIDVAEAITFADAPALQVHPVAVIDVAEALEGRESKILFLARHERVLLLQSTLAADDLHVIARLTAPGCLKPPLPVGYDTLIEVRHSVFMRQRLPFQGCFSTHFDSY